MYDQTTNTKKVQNLHAPCVISVAYRGGTPPPPHTHEQTKCWQSLAQFPVPWKIHPWQANKNTGFIHLQIEQNHWLGGFSLPCVLNWIFWTPTKKKSWVRHCVAYIIVLNYMPWRCAYGARRRGLCFSIISPPSNIRLIERSNGTTSSLCS
jgi:hypothetical protein